MEKIYQNSKTRPWSTWLNLLLAIMLVMAGLTNAMAQTGMKSVVTSPAMTDNVVTLNVGDMLTVSVTNTEKDREYRVQRTFPVDQSYLTLTSGGGMLVIPPIQINTPGEQIITISSVKDDSFVYSFTLDALPGARAPGIIQQEKYLFPKEISNPGALAPLTESITVVPGLVGNTATICNGGSVTVTINNTISGHTYRVRQTAPQQDTWLEKTGTGGSITFDPLTIVPSTSGTPIVTVSDRTDSDGFAVSFNVTIVDQPTAPTLTMDPTDTSVCEDTNVKATLNAAGTGGVTACTNSYQYSTDGGTTWNPYTLNTNISTTGLSSVKIKAIRSETTGAGCYAENIYTWTVKAKSVAATSISVTNNNTCNGTAKTLTVQGGTLGIGASWKWYSGSCGGTAEGTGLSISVDPAAGTTTTYFVRAEGGCNTTDCVQVDVVVLSNSVAPTGITVTNNGTCNGTSKTLTVDGGSLGSGAAWQWYSGSCGGTAEGTGTSISVNPPASTSVTYFVRAEGTCGNTPCASVVVNTSYPVYNVDLTTYYATLQAAIDNASNGHTIQLVCDLSEGLVSVNKDLTIDGNGKTLTSTSATWGMEIAYSGITIQNFTLKNAGTYGIQQGCNANGLVMTNVTVHDCGGTGISIYGSDNCVLTNITSYNNVGNGLNITNCDNTTVNGITTYNNAFAGGFSSGIGLFTSQTYCTPAGINGVTLTGTISIAEPNKVYSEKANAADVITGLVGTPLQWAVGYTGIFRYYWPSKAISYSIVDVLFEAPYNLPPSQIYVVEIATEDYYVNDDPNGDNTPPMLIQAAVDFQATGETIYVEAGTYNENVNVNKGVILRGTQWGQNCNTRSGAESTVSVSGGIPFTVTANGVTIDGFEITAPSSFNAISCGNTSDLTVKHNWIHNVGTTATGGNVHALLYMIGNSVAYEDVSVVDNCFDNISSASLTGFSASAIGFLQSSSTGVLTNLDISRNIINDVEVNTGNWPTGKIAYGIILNIGSVNYLTSTGKVVNAIIAQNEIAYLEGFISTGIALEGNTEDALVQNNTVSQLKGNKIANRAGGGYDLSALKIESNRYVGDLIIQNNSFLTNTFTHGTTAGLGYGISNYVPVGQSYTGGTTGVAFAECNWFGTKIYNEIADNASLNGKVFNKDLCDTDFIKYLTSGTDNQTAVIGFQPQSGVCDGEPVVITSTPTTDAICGTNGSITVNYSGGTGPYTITWTGGGPVTDSDGSPYVISLPGGNYTVTVTDANGSFATAGPVTVPYLPVTNLSDTPDTYYATIQAAITAADPGEVIYICDGTYNERVTIDKSLTLRGQSKTGAILDGISLTGFGNGITINSGVTNVTIEYLTVQNYDGASGNANAGIYAVGGNNNLTVQQVIIKDNKRVPPLPDLPRSGSGFYANGPVDNVKLDYVTSSGHTPGARGIVIWNGLKSNITITNCEVFNNNCCGIELQDGTATGVRMEGNNVHDNGDNGFGLTGMQGPGENLIKNNTVTNCGRFGIEVKLPNGSGLTTGAGRIVVEDNVVSRTVTITDVRDIVGIAAFRRGFLTGNVDIPTGVVIQNNTVSGYVQSSTSDGFGIVVEGTNHSVLNNNVTGCDVGIQQQAGHLPYPGDGNQNDLADQYFGRGNSPIACGNTISGNTFGSNGTDTRNVGPIGGAGFVVNTNTGETFCSIQAAIDDAETLNGHTISVTAGTFVENVTVNKRLTITGAGNTTIVQGVGGIGNVFTYTAAASGLDASNRGTLKNMKITSGEKGFYVQELANFIKIDDVTFDGLSTYAMHINNTSGVMNDWILNNCRFQNTNGVGIHVATAANINMVAITGCDFISNKGSGLNVSQSKATPGGFNNVTISGCDFINNGYNVNNNAGIYAEKLSNSTITGNTFSNNGYQTTGVLNARAMIINLKYADFSNVTISNNTISENRGTPTGGYAMFIAGRNDGTDYGSKPASLSIVNVNGNEMTGFPNGIGFENNVNWSTTTVSNNKILNCNIGLYGTLANIGLTMNVHENDFTGSATYHIANGVAGNTINASCNWYGTPDGDLIAAKIAGPVTYSAWYTSGGDGAGIGFQPTGVCDGTPVVAAVVADHIVCGETTGGFTVSWTGGTGPFKVDWTGPGNGTQDPATSPFTKSSLAAGTYTVTVTDFYGSTDVENVTIEDQPVHNITDNTYWTTIQLAIDNSSDGDQINICAGTYVEQLHITNNIILNGAGPSTIVKSPAVLPLSFTTSAVNKPVVFVDGATNCTIQNMTVDGDDKGNANYRFMGIAYWNAGGTMQDLTVINVMDSPFSGSQHGNAIYAYNNTAGPYSITVDDIIIYDFQKNGLTLNGNGNLNVAVSDVTVTGAGPTTVTAQNGIQLWGSSGTVNNCTIHDVNYTPTGTVSAGLLIIGPGNVITDNVNTFACQTSVMYQDASGSVKNSLYTDPKRYSILFYGLSGSNSLLVDNITTDGTGVSGDSGIRQYVTNGTTTLTVLNSDITNMDYAVNTSIGSGGSGSMVTTVTGNNLANNLYGARNFNSPAIIDARYNWWGSPTGPSTALNTPSTNPCGTGSMVTLNVDFSPWYFNASMNTLNGLPVLTLNNNIDFSTVTKTPTIISVDVAYPNDLDNYDPAVLTDALITSNPAFLAGTKVFKVIYQDGANTPVVIPTSANIGGMTSVYLSQILGSASGTPLQGHDGKTINWKIYIEGPTTGGTTEVTIQSVSYLTRGTCNTPLGAPDSFFDIFTEVSFSQSASSVATCNTSASFTLTNTFPSITNIPLAVTTDARILSDVPVPAGAVINWNYNSGAASGSYTLPGATSNILLSTIVGNGPIPLINNSGLTDVWAITLSGTMLEGYTFNLDINSIATLEGIEYIFNTRDIELIFSNIPSLSITNPAPVCNTTADITAAAVTAGSDLPATTTLSYWQDLNCTIPVTNPGAVGAGTYYIKATTQPGGCTDVEAVTVTVDPLAVGGSINPEKTMVCGTTNSGTLTLSGHVGSIVRWESSTDNGVTWTPIANTTTTYNYSNVTVTTKYRAVLHSGVCPADANSSIATIYQGVITTAGSSQVCYGDRISVPVSVKSFVDVGAISLTLDYPEDVWSFFDVTYNNIPSNWNPGTTGFIAAPTAGNIYAFGQGPGYSLPDDAVLFTVRFTYTGPATGGTYNLTWYDPDTDPEWCEYGSSLPISPGSMPFCDRPYENFYFGATVTVKPLPVVTDVTLLTSINAANWTPVGGSFVPYFEMCIDPEIEFHYLDINSLNWTGANLKTGSYTQNAFYIQTPYPSGYMAYWIAKGVVSGAPGWQGVMYQIITGAQPMFYINYTGSDYQLIDGLQHLIGQGANPLRVSGDYPEGTYKFRGTVLGANDCTSNPFDVFIKFNSAPVVTDVTMLSSIDETNWSAVAGTFTGGFEMCIDPANEYHYLDVNTLSVLATPIVSGTNSFVNNPFYINKSSVPAGFYAYWLAKNVYSGCTGPWQPTMWSIIDSAAPMFYIRNNGGGSYELIDGLMWQAFGQVTTLKVNGDYPQGNYTFSGYVTGTNGCVSSFFDIFMEFNSSPLVTNVTLLSSVDQSNWTPVDGNFNTNFELCLNPVNPYHYLDIGTLTGPVNALLGPAFVQNGFKLQTSTVPTGFYTWWAAKGVYAGCPGTWEPFMWQIISGAQPMFYIRHNGSGSYDLIDGLQYQASGGTSIQTLRVNGDYFPGMYTFIGTVTDINGCVSTPFDVKINFKQTPVITCPSNYIVNNDAGQCGASVLMNATATGTPTPTIQYFITGNPTPITNPYFFPVGTTPVTAVASNECGSVNCQFTVKVNDAEFPVIVCPANISVNNDAGICGAIVNYATPSGTDNCPGATTVQTAGLASGSVFSVGTTTNTFKVTDAAGNFATCSFDVTVTDAEDPQISCPANISVNNDVGSCGAIVNYTAPVGTDNCPGASTVQTAGLASGSLFPVGTTINTFKVTDGVGRTAECSFTVTVNDTQAPNLICPPDITVNQHDEKDPYATGYASATDNCTGTITITYNDSRAGLNLCNATGTIVRTWTAKDAYNNTKTCVQTINVIDADNPVAICPADINVNNDAGLCSAVVNFTPTATDFGHFQGFENPLWVSGKWQTVPSTDWNEYNSVLTRVPSGTDGITSKTGTAHAVMNSTVLPPAPNDWSGIFSRIGGFDVAFGNGFTSSIDVYFDVTDPAVLNNTYAWDVSTAVSTPAGGHRRDFVFHTAGYSTGKILVAASNNSNFTRRNDLGSVNHYEVTNSGWYTLEWVFRNNGTNKLAVDCNLRDASGGLLWTETRSDASDIIPTVVGGNRYMWFTFAEVDKLAIDNTKLTRMPLISTAPPSGSAFAVGTTNVTVYATDACTNIGACTFNVTVNDTEAPQITCPAPITINCNDSQLPANTGTATATDNCDSNPLITYTDQIVNGTCPGNYTINRTWKAKDIYNYESTCVQVITVQDVTPPVLTCPSDITISCDESQLPANTGIANAIDACDPGPVITYSDAAGQLIPSTFPGGTAIQGRARWGNSGFEAALYIGGTSGPNLNPAGTPFWVIGTSYLFEYMYDASTGTQTLQIDFDNNTTYGAGEIITQSTTFAGKGFKHFSIYMSGNANRSISLNNFVVNGVALGNYTSPASGDINLDWENSNGLFEDILATGTITFNGLTGGGDETGRVWFRTAIPVTTPAPPACPQNYVIHRLWTATDACGNKSQCVQNITVQDVTAPDWTAPIFKRPLPLANVNNSPNRSNVTWADGTLSTEYYGDDFILGPSSDGFWTINKVVVWGSAGDVNDPDFDLLDYFNDISLYGTNASSLAPWDPPYDYSGTPEGTLPMSTISTGTFGPGNTVTTVDGTIITVVEVTYYNGESYLGSSGSFRRLWKVTFDNLNWTVPAQQLMAYGVNCDHKFSEVPKRWFNHFSNYADSDSDPWTSYDDLMLDFAPATPAPNRDIWDVDATPYWGKPNDHNVLIYGIPSCSIAFNGCLSDAPAGPTAAEIAALFTDNCGTVSATKLAPEVTGNDCDWNVKYIYEVVDECGNMKLPKPTVNFHGGDKTPPALITPGTWPADISGVNDCMANAPDEPGNAVIAALYADACGGTITVTHTETLVSGSDDCAWTYTYEYTITDKCGNMVTPKPVFTISGGDDIPPALVGPWPADFTGVNDCMANAPDEPGNAAVAALYEDACGGTITVTHTETMLSGSDDCAWTYTYEYTITDKCGNMVTPKPVFTISGGDDIPPALVGPWPADITGVNDCMANAPDEPGNAAVAALYADACGGTITVTHTETLVPGSDDCAWTYTYEYTITDKCGNMVTPKPVFTISGGDDIPPALVGTWPANISGVNNCAANVPPEPTDEFVAGLYADACGGLITVTHIKISGPGLTPGTEDCAWSYTWEYTITDKCGNIVTPKPLYSISGGDDIAPALTGTWPPDITGVNDCMANAPDEPSDLAVAALYTDACGGFITVTHTETPDPGNDNCSWSYTYEYTIKDKCDNVVMPKPLFIISGGDDTPPVISSCPTSPFTRIAEICSNVGADKYTVQGTEFNVSAVDACGGTVTYAYVLSGVTGGSGNTTLAGVQLNVGTTTVTWTVKDACDNPIICAFDVIVSAPAKYNITGVMKYHKAFPPATDILLNNVVLKLVDATDTQVGANVVTAGSGAYGFYNLCPGTYYIKVVSNPRAPGGINATDAAQANFWGVNGGAIPQARFQAGDVDYDWSIGPGDALGMRNYFVYGTQFLRRSITGTPWTYFGASKVVSNNFDDDIEEQPDYQPYEMEIILGATTVYDIYAMVIGDFNTSFSPSSSKGAASETLALTYENTFKAEAGTEAELPLRIVNASSLTAASLILNLPAELAEITDVVMKDNNGELDWAVYGDELRIGWNTLTALPFNANELLFTVKIMTTSKFTEGQTIKLSLAADLLNELADGGFNVIPDAVLSTDILESTTFGIPDQPVGATLSLVSHPNPFRDFTFLTYSLPAEGHVTLEIADMLGHKVSKLVDEIQKAGEYTLKADAISLQPGVYTATIKLDAANGDLVKTIRIVRAW